MITIFLLFFFFFSSRRRHTRLTCDWSSDVCSSDLVVLAPVGTSYRVTAKAPVYVVAAPVSHVANTRANDPYGRARAVRRWVLTSDPRVTERYGATWAIRNGRLYRLPRR